MLDELSQIHTVVQSTINVLKSVSKVERDKPLTETTASPYNQIRFKGCAIKGCAGW